MRSKRCASAKVARCVLALACNLACLILLARHRADDLNMKSVRLCSRNGIAANLGVIVAALGVGLADSLWPDLAAIFLRSALHVFFQSGRELRQEPKPIRQRARALPKAPCARRAGLFRGLCRRAGRRQEFARR